MIIRLLLIFPILLIIFSCNSKVSDVQKENVAKFKFIISDSLAYGANLARVSEYKRNLKENETSLIAVIIENELENGSTKIDTFSDGLKTPFFGISRYQTGNQKIQIKVEEKIIRTKSFPNDSMALEIKNVYYTYGFNVFVKNKGLDSKINEILSKQMNTEYKENPI